MHSDSQKSCVRIRIFEYIRIVHTNIRIPISVFVPIPIYDTWLCFGAMKRISACMFIVYFWIIRQDIRITILGSCFLFLNKLYHASNFENTDVPYMIHWAKVHHKNEIFPFPLYIKGCPYWIRMSLISIFHWIQMTLISICHWIRMSPVSICHWIRFHYVSFHSQ